MFLFLATGNICPEMSIILWHCKHADTSKTSREHTRNDCLIWKEYSCKGKRKMKRRENEWLVVFIKYTVAIYTTYLYVELDLPGYTIVRI